MESFQCLIKRAFCTCNSIVISVIIGMEWYSNNKFTKKDHEALQQQLPNCICDRTVWQETEHGWREHERYFWMRSFFEDCPRYLKK